MDMNHYFLEYIWKVKKEEMKREEELRETYKLYFMRKQNGKK